MKTTFVVFTILFLLMTITALVCSVSYDKGGTSSNTHATSFQLVTIKSRKLQGNGYGPSTAGDSGKMNLDDYRHPMDPVPSSKASVRPGPIQHGTPLMPYIPKQPAPPPPTRSKPIGFP
ncbi:uncharacterized protein LOC129904106 [Solanum dulcamara]|uniref:uncharacterized protein LOC129904106 n=1 Tax=Solanum dulcamara TaxID=45834 RepID=UPI00248614EA|nr:uncharacterized protein LOC129904106 [Solanum dulcamara]